jgi:8-oxo-dGTP diphosphatase
MQKVVKCLILNSKSEFLLIKRAKTDTHAGLWETPGGGVDGDESLNQACIREVKEEAGFFIDSDSTYSSLTLSLMDDESKELYEVTLFTHEGDTDYQVDLSDNPDHDAYAWISIHNLGDFLSNGKQIDRWTLTQLLLDSNKEVVENYES